MKMRIKSLIILLVLLGSGMPAMAMDAWADATVDSSVARDDSDYASASSGEWTDSSSNDGAVEVAENADSEAVPAEEDSDAVANDHVPAIVEDVGPVHEMAPLPAIVNDEGPVHEMAPLNVPVMRMKRGIEVIAVAPADAPEEGQQEENHANNADSASEEDRAEKVESLDDPILDDVELGGSGDGDDNHNSLLTRKKVIVPTVFASLFGLYKVCRYLLTSEEAVNNQALDMLEKATQLKGNRERIVRRLFAGLKTFNLSLLDDTHKKKLQKHIDESDYTEFGNYIKTCKQAVAESAKKQSQTENSKLAVMMNKLKCGLRADMATVVFGWHNACAATGSIKNKMVGVFCSRKAA